MSTISLLILSFCGVIGYSLTAIRVYSSLPRTLGALGDQHGRYARLGRDLPFGDTPSGTAAVRNTWQTQTV